MVGAIAGLTTYTPDARYLLGGVPELEGFLVAGSGGMGSVLTELLIDGRCSLDLAPFRVERFGRWIRPARRSSAGARWRGPGRTA